MKHVLRFTNRLVYEKSPYLQQHAHNPVDWYPWGGEAFEKSRKDDLPIFLSIGYSTCHWCHVMERESFENESIADLMNRHFVCIKVDREERPDIDAVYMSAVQAMTGSGGWPLSVFLTSDLKPFYGGTYFPPRDMRGRPGFPTLLERIHEVWKGEREQIQESGDKLLAFLRQDPQAADAGSPPDASLLKRAYHQFAAEYDPRFGGFGGGPKFPRPAVLNFLFRYYDREGTPEALEMALTTLRSMARGGMYDQLGGGFHRYSVDGQWRVPHFEKMLYDQAQLVCSYLDAYQITHDEFFAAIIRETLAYVVRDMTDPGGGFYSAEDADSSVPGKPAHSSEGAFYLWSKREIEDVLGTSNADLFCRHFGVVASGNALTDPQGEFEGRNILFTPFTVDQTADFFARDGREVADLLDFSRRTLHAAREKRPRPFRDDKILVAWNGLMISAFARASRVLGEPSYAIVATRAARFVLDAMFDPATTTLKRRFRELEVGCDAHLDDYAFFIQGLLDLYEATFDHEMMNTAFALHGTQVALFWDSSEGGFYDFSGVDKAVLVRRKGGYDGAEPSGNSVAAMNLLRLSQLTDDDIVKKQAERTITAFQSRLAHNPSAMPNMLAAVDFFLSSPVQIVIAGEKRDEGTKAFLGLLARTYLPKSVLMLADGGEGQRWLAERLPFLTSLVRKNGKSTAFVCRDYACDLPTNDPEQFLSLLQDK